jgi:1,2-diacylglycerol 3-alpha-glucosyltransferase
MNILLLNSILYTPYNNKIPKVSSIKECIIYNLALGFKELGHTITLLAAAEYKPTQNEQYEINVIFLKSSFKRLFPPTVLPCQPCIWSYLKKEKKNYDIIISSEVFSFPSLFAVLQCPKKTIVWHELAAHQQKIKQIPSRFWYNIIAKLFFKKSLVVARSERARKFISQYLPNVSSTTIDHGVDSDKFLFSREKQPQFIVVGRLVPRKNIGNILNKFSQLISNSIYNHFKLIIAGRADDAVVEKKLKQQTVELGIEANVEFVGSKPHSELNRLIAKSMAMLVDTGQDNNMLSISESIVAGTPVITNLVPTNASIIREHKLGIVKNNWDEKTLTDIIENNALYVDNCIAYRELLSTKYSAQQFIDVFTYLNK